LGKSLPSWPGNDFIENLDAAGLPTVCVVRLQLFTLGHRLAIRKASALSAAGQKKLRLEWKEMLAV